MQSESADFLFLIKLYSLLLPRSFGWNHFIVLQKHFASLECVSLRVWYCKAVITIIYARCIEINHHNNTHDGFPRLINIPGEEECPATIKAQKREQRKLNSLSRNTPFPWCYEKSEKTDRKDVKKSFILLSQISSPLISSSCNFPCSAKNQLYLNHSWKMLISSSHFSPFSNTLFHITEQSWTRKTGVLHGEMKLPQECTWCISAAATLPSKRPDSSWAEIKHPC